MSKLLKALALLLLVTTLVWGVTIWQWQRTPRVLDTYQVVFHLLLLPAALSVFAWLLYAFAGALMRHAGRAADPAAAAGAAPAEPVADAGHPSARQEASWTHALWGATAAAGPAADLDQLAARLQSGQRPALDPQLMDSRGLPVFTGRCPDLDTLPVDAELQVLRQALAADRSDMPDATGEPDAEPGPRVLRALALLDRALPPTLAALPALAAPLLPHEHRGGGPSGAALSTPRFVVAGEQPSPLPPARTDRPAMAAQAARSSSAHEPLALAPPQARHDAAASFAVCWLVPADWSAAERRLARLWLGRRLAGALPGVAASDAIVLQPCAQAEQALQQLDQRLVAWRREGRRGLLLALAAESLVGLDWVDRLEQHGLLFAAERPEGRVPGEAAVALLLSTPDWPAPLDEEIPTALRLHRPALARRGQPVDPARVSARVLQTAMADALAAAGLHTPPPDAAAPDDSEDGQDDASLVGLACTDLDTRPSRSSEAARALLGALPALNPVADVQALGQALGDVGLPRALLALAAASHAVRASGAPALVFTVHDPLERAAVVLAPSGPTDTVAHSPTAHR